ncbi:ATP-binding protein [Campylobacter sp. US33a]|uniref:ATP-binding protein n=1 Tax=Campylobacter sp. US33a TaxID=2498120 RepID=UPI001419D8BD|nr:AAA family ATPase [Campylobacter sp. US33a]
MINSPYKLSDVGGAFALKEYAKNVIEAEKCGYKCKGIFLVGVPGTGKTFFPKCFAGELNRPIIQLNLSEIIESDKPIAKLNSIFFFLTKMQKLYPTSKYIILIDEIEKMIGNSSASSGEKQILGRLLTVLNDMHTEASEFNFDAIFFATANNLGNILSENPEFLRRGRWNELFFIHLPTEEFAEEIFRIYIKKKKLEAIFQEEQDLKDLMSDIICEYSRTSLDGRFPYTAAEIESFCDRISFFLISKKEKFDAKQDIKRCIKDIFPISKTAFSSVSGMVAQKDLFVEI